MSLVGEDGFCLQNKILVSIAKDSNRIPESTLEGGEHVHGTCT